MTLLEVPTGILLFYHKDIKQEIMHTLLLEKYGVSKKWVIIMDIRQDLNATLTPAGKSGLFWLRIVIVPEGYGEAQRNGMETEENMDKSSNFESYFTSLDVRCFFETVL